MKSKTLWVLFGVFFIFLCIGGMGFAGLWLIFSGGEDWPEPKGDIAIVEVKGAIFESAAINEKLEKYRKNDSVKAVVLRIDSPGGSVGASQEIYTEVKKLVQKKKVIVSMGAVAASGGYYIAAPATKIVANPGTITGSIGVLMDHVEIEELLKWAKVSAEILKAGRDKDVGSSLRKMSPEDRVILQGILDNMHEQFLQAVAEGRKIDLEEVRKIGTGRVYTGQQALDLKLIDQFGNFEDAIDVAAKEAGIKGEPTLIKPEKRKPMWIELLLGDEREEKISALVHEVLTPKALYWMSFR